ncbi:MAG: PEGA domain-containing protein [Candidatus Levybacteria bacterium]|nr:PEGA domain-containing protein [Candidatus Levybacteria bacterium]
MKRKILLLIAILLVASGLFLLVRVIYTFKDVGRGGLQVTANVQGKVLLDGKHIGDVPVRKINQQDTIPIGNYELRIEPRDTAFPAYTVRLRINSGVLTAVDKTFLPGSLGSSYVLTLEKSSNPKPQIEITSIPDGSLITIDSVAVGTTPYKSDSLSSSEHEVELQKEGFAKKTIRVRTIENHVLVLSAQLGTGDNGTVPDTLPSPTIINPSTSPTPTQAENANATILSTPNGFLRVRSGPGTSFGEVARVKPGESYTITDEQPGWYQIQVDPNTIGWVSSQFTRKE